MCNTYFICYNALHTEMHNQFMEQRHLIDWLELLGYRDEENQLFLEKESVAPEHPYSIEMWEMLNKDGDIRASAIFDVEGVPTVAFFDRQKGDELSESSLQLIRQKLWNQNLVSVVLVFDEAAVTAFPVSKKKDKGQRIDRESASQNGLFSASEIASSDIRQRLPLWFKTESRVDKRLLKNLSDVIQLLQKENVEVSGAQILVGQMLFISYLEHRDIVSNVYRERRQVDSLESLIANKDRAGISELIEALQQDFNGDFLASVREKAGLWKNLNDQAFELLNDFLQSVDVATGQTSFWNYDFSKIPVELLSGIYESFLGDEQKNLAAYYTPRHLANLTIDQALIDSPGILKEVVLDGACGSGILLTTFFRRLLSAAEREKGKQLTLRERVTLLKQHIFGSDLNDSALRVTAFSLYLSLLERLEPRDVAALQENHSVKLPHLRKSNLFSGEAEGDFFSSQNAHLDNNKITLVLSNPPWKEPSKNEVTSADKWIENTSYSVSNRQVASSYALRAADYLDPNGRVCLIMPVGQLVSPSASDFLKNWLSVFKPTRIINFADLQQLLFKSASHSCFICVAKKRDDGKDLISSVETFEYCVPKSDVSLALGRLTLQSGDRLRLQTQSVFEDHNRLATLMWGTKEDLALITKLRAQGSILDFLTGPIDQRRWVMRGGVHIKDRNTVPVSSEPIKHLPFVRTDVFKLSPGVLHSDFLCSFPQEVDEVANITESLLSVFDGPRVLFPDGFDSKRQLRSAYFDQPAAFTVSVNTISGSKEDSDLLKFLSVFLRSKLASYFLIMSSWQVMADRNAVRNVNVKSFPFFAPENSPDPSKATSIIKKVVKLLDTVRQSESLHIKHEFNNRLSEFNQLVYDYFSLTEREIALVEDVVNYVSPSIRPRSFKKIYTQMQYQATESLITGYAARLKSELERWRTIMGGDGKFNIDVITPEQQQRGENGIVRISLKKNQARMSAPANQVENAVKNTLAKLKEQSINNQVNGPSSLAFSLDTFVWVEDALYIAKPLIVRYWLQRNAIKDARLIVEAIHRD